MKGLHEEFMRDINILEKEFDDEKEQSIRMHKMQVKELEDMIETVKEEEKKKQEDANSEHQGYREETKNKNLEETNHMRMLLDSRQTKYYNDLEQMH